nr:non-lysosomal glucosylceramidase-like isoform X1 [Ipomoea batatas]GMD06992.1 non-lysosomal glucosylceramidase-like isoform X1 [Ipomoea batatas]GMD08913.1 non-lysosomal glucosylceramidase-like isoform X1 [Ipomoea batatas]GMD10124.1 non-lysosomal glucosylceramidase-like isoform X1 [Ipomoea batatas]
MLANGFHGGEGESSEHDKVKVNPGKHPSLTWQRKLDTEDTALSEFNISVKEMVAMAPIGYRLWRRLQERKGKEGLFVDPFTRRPFSSCQGVPLGGMGAGSIGRSYKGEFLRWQFFPRICEDKPVLANQFSVSLLFNAVYSIHCKFLSFTTCS